MVRIKIQLSYYYDKPFYFISIDDERKLYLKIQKGLNYINNSSSKVNISQSQKNVIDKKIRMNFKKLLNNNVKYISNVDKDLSINTNMHKADIDKALDKLENDKNDILNKIEKYRKDVNRDEFIKIIKIILFIIIVLIFAIYIIIIIFQRILINRSQHLITAYYYNTQTENSLLNIYSLLLEIYYNSINLSHNKVSNYTQQQKLLIESSNSFKTHLYNFTEYFIYFNLEVNSDFNVLYKKRKFYKIEGFWEEIESISELEAELELIIFNLYSINTSILYSVEIRNELNNFYFFNNKTSSLIKIESSFIKTLYYLCANYEFSYKDIFNEFKLSMFLSFNEYIYSNMNFYFILEIFGLLFYIMLFISVIIYLHYSNQIILKNVIFLFLDFTEEQYYKNRLNSNNKIILKLLELQYLINDFNLENFQKFSDNIETLNKTKNKDININNKNLSSIFNLDTSKKTNEVKKHQSHNKIISPNNFLSNKSGRNSIQKTSSKNMFLLGKKERESEKMNSKKYFFKLKSIANADFKVNRFSSRNTKLNDSAQNFLLKIASQALSIKEKQNHDIKLDQINDIKKLNNNSIIGNDINFNNEVNQKNQINQTNKQNNNNTIEEYIFKQQKKYSTVNDDENDSNEIYQDMLLNKSNKTQIFIIKIYIIIILFLIVVITIFCVFKIKLTYEFKFLLNYYFVDYFSLTNRYTLLTYYFNIFRTLIIFPEGKRKNSFIQIMENINNEYEKENRNYTNILSYRINNYKETKELFEILQNKHNTSEILKNIICQKEYSCEYFLDSFGNNFDSGVDFVYKTCINQINNIYMDYKKLNNKTNITEIKDKLLSGDHSQFGNIGSSINNMFFYVQKVIFKTFQVDQLNFKNKYSNDMTFLNIISVMFSILTFLFVNIIIFISISNFSKPIKNSTYRINCSFYFIKKYSLANRRNYTQN